MRHGLEYRDVARAGHQQPDVDPVQRRGPEGLHVGRGAGKVRVGDPQRLASRAGDELVEAEQPGGARLVADHPEPRVAEVGHLRAP
jgi:hypothetical protein